MRIIAVLSLLIMVGCADEAISPPPPFALVFDENASEEHVAAVMAAADAWNTQLGVEVFYRAQYHRGQDISDVAVSFHDVDLLPLRAGEPPTVVGAARRESQYSPWTVDYANRAVDDAGSVRHELGHVLGIVEHSEDPTSAMWSWANPAAINITAEDVEQVRRLWDL
jgi:hypothetical protein